MSKENNQLMNEYYGLANPCTGTHNSSSNSEEIQGQLGGKLWNWIKRNAGAIVGALIGGPVGALVGAAIDEAIEAIQTANAEGMERVTVEINNIDVIQDQYPIRDKDSATILKWFTDSFLETIKSLANLVDTEIILVQNSRLTSGVNNKVIESANQVLRAIAVFRAWCSMVLEEGEVINPGQIWKRSVNFTINKVAYMEYFLNVLEKAVFAYVESNTNDYKLVVENQLVSNTTNIEQTSLYWQGKTVKANVKKYVAKTKQTTTNQTEVVVTNTDVTSETPSTNEETVVTTPPVAIYSDSNATNDNSSVFKPKYLKWLALFGIGLIAYKAINNNE